MALYHFISGGAADGQFDLLSETVQTLLSELSGSKRRRLRYISLYNGGAAAVFVKLYWSRSRQTVAFGGTIGNGDYVTNFAHASLASGGVDVTTERAGGTPADASALAVQHEADIEGTAALAALIANANDNGSGTNSILTTRGVRGLTITTTPPGSATMTVAAALPDLTADLPDAVIEIPALTAVNKWLGDEQIVRLYGAATEEAALGATAPSADISGYIVLD